MKLPEGWPTREMVTAGHFELVDPMNMINNAVRAAAVFKAMYEAAPGDELRKAAEDALAVIDEYCFAHIEQKTEPDAVKRVRENLRAELDKLKP